MAARESYIAGAAGVGELTGAVQTCVGLWESGLALADVQGTDLLTRAAMAIAARGLALRGEAVFLIRETGLVPVSDWEVSTRDGVPRAYRLSLSDAGGGRSQTALAAEVLHFRHGSDATAPWTGTAPLRRAQLTAGMLQAIEAALAEVYADAPLGSQIVPYPEATEPEKERLGRAFRGSRGRVILRESVQVSAAGGPAPMQDWQPRDLSPDLSKSLTREHLAGARDSICGVFGVLPALLNPATTGPMVREAQRHLATWALQPIAMRIAEEASAKLGGEVMVDTLRPLQAFDVGGRARALGALITAMSDAKAAGIEGEALNKLLTLVNWGEGDHAA
ncbi:phage portal protein [Limimaricola sp.]|uniref:phage portal protein n=1 Tax=Limimaricola sp. TaxID=2211665 RepID=UPI0025BE6EA5|nr:phage portal protein [Limimaricola sp.]